MEKDTRIENTAWKNAAEEASSLIIQHSWERLSRDKFPSRPEHKAYRALVLTIAEAIEAFIALDESLE